MQEHPGQSLYEATAKVESIQHIAGLLTATKETYAVSSKYTERPRLCHKLK